jgi:Zn-dependent M28 family amino/carboxypeptidase
MVGRRVYSRPFPGIEAYRITQFLAEGIGPRVAGSEQERAAGESIFSTFRGMGYHTTIQVFETPDGKESRNVVAASSDPLPERYIVVGAHYDSVAETPSANDNASGVGVLIETALCLAGIDLPIPIVYVAFGSEEGPHAGSKHFVSLLESPSVIGMINLDAVGVDAEMEIGGYGDGDPWLADHCRGTAEWLGYTLSECHFGGKSDYASFADAGIPVACFARTDQSSAHTPDDNMTIISRAGIAQIGEVLVTSLANLPARRARS